MNYAYNFFCAKTECSKRSTKCRRRHCVPRDHRGFPEIHHGYRLGKPASANVIHFFRMKYLLLHEDDNAQR